MDGRFWISHMWVEAEPVARGVKPPKNRDYFHRYKVRFDWLESQGTPWWLKSEHEESTSSNTDTAKSTTYGSDPGRQETELIQSRSAASHGNDALASTSSLRDRLKISALCDPPFIAASRSNSADDSGVNDERSTSDQMKHRSAIVIDPLTGLMTPPITPPQAAKSSLTKEDQPGISARPSNHEADVSGEEVNGALTIDDTHNAEDEDCFDHYETDEEVGIQESMRIPGTKRLKSEKPIASFSLCEPL